MLQKKARTIDSLIHYQSFVVSNRFFHRMTSLIPTFEPKADVRTFLYAGMVLFVGMPRIYF
mgnify:CR=1 FL=1